MIDTPAQAKIQVLERSLSVFALGLIALVPVIGLPAALLALSSFRRACLLQKENWNAGRRYLLWGFIFASIGLIKSLLVIGFVLYLAFNNELF